MSGSRRSGACTRRQFLVRAGALGAGSLSLAAFGSACGKPEDDANTLYVENWPAYIDPTTESGPGGLDRFVAATGVDVRYSEPINDYEEYFSRLQPRLGTGRRIEADVFVAATWLAARIIRLGWADPLPLDAVPNAANVQEFARNPGWDPSGQYTLPWQGGMTGLAYNRATTGRDIRSLNELFDPEFRGRVGMLTEMEDTIGLLLLSLGIDPEHVSSFAQAEPAFERLEAAKQSGQVRAFTGGDYLDDLSTGNFALCMAWSVDALQLARDNPDVRFVVPDEGAMRWLDTMMMPRGARHRATAAKWMNFFCDPAEAARVTAFVQGMPAIAGARAEVAKLDPDLAASPLVFPDEATERRLKVFPRLHEDVDLQFQEAFARIIGA